jgi:hypothetical protein
MVGSSAQDSLPFPDPPMGGKVGPTMQESVHKWREEPSRLPADAPNIQYPRRTTMNIKSLYTLILAVFFSCLLPLSASAEEKTEPVTVANFVRAESDHMIRANMEMVGVTFGKFVHLREPTTPDNQPVIRMNQDTLYSATVLDCPSL